MSLDTHGWLIKFISLETECLWSDGCKNAFLLAKIKLNE